MKVVPPAGVASPCTDVCTMDPATGWCLGCRRTIDEIAAWGALDDTARRQVLAQIGSRRFPVETGVDGEAPR